MRVLGKYIKNNCANWCVDTCIGATILNTGIFNDTGICWVMEGGVCPYFEKYLIPMANSTPKGEAAVSEYRLMVKK